MTTKSPLLSFLALLMAATTAMSASMSTLSPADAVEYARDIAVGVVLISRENGLEVRFKPQTILKGNMQPGSDYIVNYADDYNRAGLHRVIEKIAAYAEGKPAVMFVGYLAADGKTLIPESFDGAIWPRENKDTPLFQTPDTLEECVTFVTALLADPKLKLKHVNGRRVLPDGYILPPSLVRSAKTASRADSSAYLPPSKAVESAEDVALGSLQVSRENGLEMRFTPQTVLKGRMQPGRTVSVKYSHDYPSSGRAMEQIAAYVEGKPTVMLLGRLDADGKTFEPEGSDGAVWPRPAKWGGVFQTPDTLEGCVNFVKALLTNPDLKLKIVNDRQMLPEDYTPPSSGTPAGATPPGGTPSAAPTTPKVP